MFQLCAPALIYLIFSIIQILFDTFNGFYNTAFMKFIVMIMLTILLNILCQSGMGIISWLIVFIPFILMTIIASLLLWIFGLNVTTGTLDYSCDKQSTKCKMDKNISKDISGNIIIYNPYYDPYLRPVVYRSPNIIVPPTPEDANYYPLPPARAFVASDPEFH